MFSGSERRAPLMAEITRDCEYLLVEAAIGFAKDREWVVRGLLGREYRAALTVNEWTDSPLIELRDVDTSELVKIVGIHIMCWATKEV